MWSVLASVKFDSNMTPTNFEVARARAHRECSDSVVVLLIPVTMDIVELEDALPEAHAPVDEPATSADELGEDDEAACLLSLSLLWQGAWVVLHGIVG